MQAKHPKQGASKDCGIFVMKTAEMLLKGEGLKFSQDDMPELRKEILGVLYANMEICEGW